MKEILMLDEMNRGLGCLELGTFRFGVAIVLLQEWGVVYGEQRRAAGFTTKNLQLTGLLNRSLSAKFRSSGTDKYIELI
ncbi:hypothetical protein CFP56_028483 [Quercus suber]|uniref:Uncharacterized protein n=1 Tax=Quercus suber TaxID=58331 RepID=A0AAW0JVS4_QUESU